MIYHKTVIIDLELKFSPPAPVRPQTCSNPPF